MLKSGTYISVQFVQKDALPSIGPGRFEVTSQREGNGDEEFYMWEDESIGPHRIEFISIL